MVDPGGWKRDRNCANPHLWLLVWAGLEIIAVVALVVACGLLGGFQ